MYSLSYIVIMYTCTDLLICLLSYYCRTQLNRRNTFEGDVWQCIILSLLQAITLREVNEKVLGVHLTGPNAGEIMQGFAAAMR